MVTKTVTKGLKMSRIQLKIFENTIKFLPKGKTLLGGECIIFAVLSIARLFFFVLFEAI